MLKRAILTEININRREFFIVFFLLFNAFTWWYMTLILLATIAGGFETSQQTLVWTTYYFTVIGSSILGSTISTRIEKISFFRFWIVLGTVISLFPVFFNGIVFLNALFISFLWAFSFGVGIPSCISYFADSTVTENRGRVGGVTFLAINLSVPILAILLGFFGLLIGSIVSVLWRGLGATILLKPRLMRKPESATRKPSSFVSILRNRYFLLYFIPWLMFCFINRLEGPILMKFFGVEQYRIGIAIESIASSVFAFVAGVMADSVGRKRVIIYGFVSLGVAYALVGIFPSTASWYFYSIIDGMVWGIFAVTFLLVLWGDLSPQGGRERYYVVGSIPFLLTDWVQLLLAPILPDLIKPYAAAFSLSSFFLFLAVLPVMYAPETLPQRKIELRQLKGYIEQAKKASDKYLKKGNSDA
jgi:MFS family permease